MALTVFVRTRNLVIANDQAFYQFDRTGRFLMKSQSGSAVRRGLDGRLIGSTIIRPIGYREYHAFSPQDKAIFYVEIDQVLRMASMQPIDERQSRWIARAQAITSSVDPTDHEAFYQTYQHVSILPPDQYRSLVVQIAEGCSYNRCAFCDFYQDRAFHVKNDRELFEHLTALRQFFGERLQDRFDVFLGDGNALVVETNRLLTMMQAIRDAFPELPEDLVFSTFMDTFHEKDKSLAELQTIVSAGLHNVYVGLETGLDALRLALKKPGKAEDARSAIALLKQSGFRLGVIVLVGVGGQRYAKEHREATIALLRMIDFDDRDMIYLSPFVNPQNQAYDAWISREGLELWDSRTTYEELAVWKKTLHEAQVKAKVTLYSIEEHLY